MIFATGVIVSPHCQVFPKTAGGSLLHPLGTLQIVDKGHERLEEHQATFFSLAALPLPPRRCSGQRTRSAQS